MLGLGLTVKRKRCKEKMKMKVSTKKMKMEAKRETNADIPIKVLVDILSRLPAKFVWSLRSVCKHWQSLIEAPSFADLHLRRSKDICLMFWGQRKPRDKTRFYSIDKDGKAVRVVQEEIVHLSRRSISSTNGLICYVATDGHIKVCNPVTRELITLPKPTFLLKPFFKYIPGHHTIEVGIGFDSITKKCKVMASLAIDSVNQWNKTDYPVAEIFTLGESEGWRRVQVPPSLKIRQRLYANGCIYWCTSEFNNIFNNVDGDMTRALMEFNFAEEKFEFVSLPSDIDTRNNSYWMLDVGGCLCLHEQKGDIKGKNMKLRAEQGWVNQHIVRPPFRPYPISFGVMLGEKNMRCGHKKRYIYYYDEAGRFVKSIKVQGIPCSLEPRQHHFESVVSLKSILAAAAES